MQVDPGLLKRFEQAYEVFAEEKISYAVLRCDDPTDVHLAIPYPLAVGQRFQQFVDELQSHQLRVINVSASRVWFQSATGRQFYGDWTCLMVRG